MKKEKSAVSWMFKCLWILADDLYQYIPQTTTNVNRIMPLQLHFDGNRFYNDLVDKLIITMDELNQEFYQEAVSRLKEKSKSATEIEPAILEKTSDYKNWAGTEFINARCKFYALAILDSYGTGSVSDDGPHSYWDDYKKSDLFNPLRQGTRKILGRPAGPYTNIFGKDAESKGRFAGMNLEGRAIHPRKARKKTELIISPQFPSMSIQKAEDFIIKDGETRIERRIRDVISEFFRTEAGKYFYTTGSV